MLTPEDDDDVRDSDVSALEIDAVLTLMFLTNIAGLATGADIHWRIGH